MARFPHGYLSVLLGSLLLFGCESQGENGDEESQESSTSGGEGDIVSSTTQETGQMSSGSSQDSSPTLPSPSSSETSSAPSSSDSTSQPPTSSSSSTSSDTPSSTEPIVHKIELWVPGYKKLLGDGGKSVRLIVAPMGSSDASRALLDRAVTVSPEGLIVLELNEPETTDPSKASQLRQYMVTLYRDKDEDQKPGKGDEFFCTLLDFLVYRADMEPKLRWRKFDPSTRKAVPITEKIRMKSVWNPPERKEVMLGGKVSDVPKDMVSVSLFMDVEKQDLKKNFLLASRGLDYKIPKDKLFWEATISERMNRRRWAEEKSPVIRGLGRHGLAWFGGYHTPTLTLIPTVRRNSKVTDELCHGSQALVAIWIEPSPEWVTSMTGAFLVAYHDMAPGWNVVKVDRSSGAGMTFRQISKEDRYELTFSPICSGLRADADSNGFSMSFPTIDTL